MTLGNKFRMKLNVKEASNKFIPVVTANDTTIFEFEVYDGKDEIELLETYNFNFVTKPVGKGSVLYPAELNEDGNVVVELNFADVNHGHCDCALVMYEGEKRVSTMRMKVDVKGDLSLQGDLPSESRRLIIADEAQLSKAVSIADEVESARNGQESIGARFSGIDEQIEANKESTISLSEQVTTPDKPWSTTTQMLKLTINGEQEKITTKPMREKGKIVVLGSSTFESSVSGSFFGLLKSTMEAKGYSVLNRGIGGSTTSMGVERFHKDVAAYNPDFCVIYFTIGNEGVHSTEANYKQFLSNLLRLINLCKQHDIVPIICNQFPTKNYSVDGKSYMWARLINDELDSMNVHVIDFMGALNNMEGSPIESAMADAVHTNLTGHEALFRALPPSLFEKARTQNAGILNSSNGFINLGQAEEPGALSYTPEYPINSFTVFVRFRPQGIVHSAVLATNGGSTRLVSNTDGTLYFNSTENVLPTDLKFTTNEWISLAMSYNYLNNEVRFYINGEVARNEDGTPYTVTQNVANRDVFYIGSRPGALAWYQDADVKDFVLYRTRLRDEQVRAIHEGQIHQTSLEVFSPMSDKVTNAGANLLNLAPTHGKVKISNAVTTVTPRSI